ncbi:MAG: hypothetical protein LUQ65_04150, partial [Candidatus Helarchaeota archaeon]|nr:hypothetical protein [Candidatus Helarchaeota archaeon]
MVCRPDAQGRSLCTVTISGLGEIFRSSFWADEFRDAYTSNNILLSQRNRLSFMNLALPWEDVVESDYSTLNDSPDGLVCAVSIKTVDKFIDFLPPYQHETQCDQAEGQIEAAFDDDRSAINIRFDGYSPNIARRIEVLAIAGLLLLGQSASGYIRRRQDRKLVIQAEEPKKLLQLESVGAVLIPGEKGTEDVSHPNWMSTRKFILAWWTASILIIALWVVTSYLDGWSIFRPNCFLSVWDYRSLISITPVRNLISISPWIIFSTLLAVLQWHVLRMQIHVSGWWIAAPVIAGLPLLF